MNLVNNCFELNGTGISVTNLAKIITWFLFQILQGNLSNCIDVSKKNIITGSGPWTKWLWSGISFIWMGGRKKTRKGMSSCFSWGHALRKIWKKDIEKIIKEYLHLSLLWGTVQHTKDDVVVLLQWKIVPLVIQNFSSFSKTQLSPLKTWSMHMQHHMVIWDLESHMPSSVRWTMAPSHIISVFLLPFFLIYCVECPCCCQEGTTGWDHRHYKGEGGGTWGRSAEWR